MATITTAELLEKLKIQVRDTGNQQWTEPEMEEALEDALLDPAFAEPVEDTLTLTSTTQDYTIPETIDVVSEVSVVIGNQKYPLRSRSWEQINETLRFANLPSAGSCLLTGYKIPAEISEKKSNLAIYLAIIKLYEMIEHEFTTGILMSDITAAEIGNILDRFERKVEKERSKVKDTRGYKI